MQLKGFKVSSRGWAYINFNLSKVQLKEGFDYKFNKDDVNFNLSKVQLKEDEGFRRSILSQFQSLQGAIKSVSKLAKNRPGSTFQSLQGAIKRADEPGGTGEGTAFQSLQGAIKRPHKITIGGQ